MNKLRQCKRCAMDESAEGISFDDQGKCNYCEQFIRHIQAEKKSEKEKKAELDQHIKKIQKSGKGKEYDCVFGLSGGVDSSYALYKIKNIGLRPLVIHLDNGWNSELSVHNIESLIKNTKTDLYTHVIDWEEFKDLQRSFMHANVIDIEMLTDHAMQAILFKKASELGVKYIITGSNNATEGMAMPKNWNHLKIDLANILDIYKKFGNGLRLKTFPKISILGWLYYTKVLKINWFPVLDYFDYNKELATNELVKEVGYKPYEKKHYESVFTRFYQGYILPEKFGVDKRKMHLSSLICTNQITREDALKELETSPYDDHILMEEDKEYVAKKLSYTAAQFDEYIKTSPVKHTEYKSYAWFYYMLLDWYLKRKRT